MGSLSWGRVVPGRYRELRVGGVDLFTVAGCNVRLGPERCVCSSGLARTLLGRASKGEKDTNGSSCARSRRLSSTERSANSAGDGLLSAVTASLIARTCSRHARCCSLSGVTLSCPFSEHLQVEQHLPEGKFVYLLGRPAELLRQHERRLC